MEKDRFFFKKEKAVRMKLFSKYTNKVKKIKINKIEIFILAP